MQSFGVGNSLPVYSILFIEDNYDDFELIGNHLAVYKEAGLVLEHADTLAAAQCRLLRGGIDIILLDLSLPDSQGIDTFKKVHLCAPSVPIVVLSGTSDMQLALESLKYGAEDYLLKDSVDIASLGRHLNYALTRHTAREANNRLATIVEASDDAIIGETLDGTIVTWNKGASKLFGFSAAEAIGKSIDLIVPSEALTELATILKIVVQGGSVHNFETTRMSKSGKLIDISATISPIVRGDGSISGAAEIDRDITERKQAQRVLQESEERYRLLVSGVQDYAIFMIDSEGFVESWNEGARRLKGYEANEIIGKHFSLFYTNEERQLNLPDDLLRNAIADGSSNNEGWRIRKDGSRFFADVVITPLYSAACQLLGFTKITRDITERKLAEQELSETRLRLSLALSAAAVGVWDFDLVNNSVWRSLRNDEIFGYKELLPEWNFDIFATHVLPEDLASAREAFRSGLERGNLRLQCRIIRSNDQAIRWIAVRGETFWNDQGTPVRMLGTIIDNTDAKEQQEQQRLVSIMQEREDFMATLTHDMKNPLIGANRLLEMFVAGGLGDLTSQQHKMLQCLKEANAGLLTLIADLIDVYRLEKNVNDLFIEDCNLIAIINACVDRLAPLASLRSVTVTTHLPAKMLLQADKSRLERVVQNLLDNASKFAPDGGTIFVRLLRVDSNIVIEIEDNGPGIQPEEHSRLFKRFSQGAAGKRYTGGSGLGLYLCKQIVEAHGGTIVCQSQPNMATIFRVCIPLVGSVKGIHSAASCQNPTD